MQTNSPHPANPRTLNSEVLLSSSPQNVRSRVLTYFAVFLLGGGMVWAVREAVTPSQPTSNVSPSIESPQIANATPTSSVTPTTPANFVTDVVNRVGPAVVRIDAERTVTTRRIRTPFDDPFFQQFFDVPPVPQERVQRGSGSGFVLNADGHVITNAHVIDGADSVTITLKDGRTFEGRVIGSDPLTDVAVVKIEADNLPTVTLADSDRLQPGEWTIAIGNPLGLDNTVTAGILSATGRSSSEIGVPDKRVEFLQTDAAINPGNSGGPLLNQNGEVIGMNTAIIQNAQGLGFAIPANTVSRIAEELIATGKVRHPYLGIQMISLTPEIKDNLNRNLNSGITINEDAGIFIVRVMPDSPAESAGLRAGDIIVKIDGNPVKTAEEVQKTVADLEVGSSLPLELKRNSRTMTLDVRIGEVGR